MLRAGVLSGSPSYPLQHSLQRPSIVLLVAMFLASFLVVIYLVPGYVFTQRPCLNTPP